MNISALIFSPCMICDWKQSLFEPRHDKTIKMAVRPAKTRISLGIRPVWSESSLSAWRSIGSLATHWAHSEDSDQTGRMPRLIWVLAGRTLIGFVMSWLICSSCCKTRFVGGCYYVCLTLHANLVPPLNRRQFRRDYVQYIAWNGLKKRISTCIVISFMPDFIFYDET